MGVTHFSCASNLSLPYHLLHFHRHDIWWSAVSMKSASMYLLLCPCHLLPIFSFHPPSSTLNVCYTIWKRPLFSPIKCMIFTKKIMLVTIEYLNNRGRIIYDTTLLLSCINFVIDLVLIHRRVSEVLLIILIQSPTDFN